MIRVVALAVVLALVGCWPPVKVGAGGGGSLGGARVYDSRGPIETDEVASTEMRMLIVPTAFVSDEPIARRIDFAFGYMREVVRSTREHVRQGGVVELTWLPLSWGQSPNTRWRVGGTTELVIYGSDPGPPPDRDGPGVGATFGVIAQYAVDGWSPRSGIPPPHDAFGRFRGDLSVGVFLRGGVRQQDGEPDAILLAGVELQIPGFCWFCSSRDRLRGL